VTTIKEVEAAIVALGVGTPEYHESMAFYLLTMARAQWRLADRARQRPEAVLQRFRDSEMVRKNPP
jgi:hypothetical protein